MPTPDKKIPRYATMHLHLFTQPSRMNSAFSDLTCSALALYPTPMKLLPHSNDLVFTLRYALRSPLASLLLVA